MHTLMAVNRDMQNVASGAAAASEKALYALSTIIRNSHDGQSQFYSSRGLTVLAKLLGGDCSPRQLRGTLDLVTDLSATDASVEVSARILRNSSKFDYSSQQPVHPSRAMWLRRRQHLLYQ